MGPELADAYLMHHIFRWNTNAAHQHRGMPDYGCFSLELLDLLQVIITLHGIIRITSCAYARIMPLPPKP